MAQLAGATVAFLATHGVEEVELTEPWRVVREAGGEPVLLSLEHGTIRAFNHLEPSREYTVDATVEEVSADDYAGLVLPGGVANPDLLRTDPAVRSFVRTFVDRGAPVAAICHAPWTLIDAGVAEGRTLTSFPSLRADLENAGAVWVDEEVVLDGGLVTSRTPDDLPAFCAAALDELAASIRTPDVA